MRKRYVFLSVFVVLLVILIYVSGTFATKKYNLSSKFGISGNVVDYGIYEDEKKLMDKFIETYVENLKKGEKTYLITGNEKEIKISSYEDIYQGKVNLLLPEGEQKMNINEKKYGVTKLIPNGKNVDIVINGEKYNFDIKENENVYLIITEKIE